MAERDPRGMIEAWKASMIPLAGEVEPKILPTGEERVPSFSGPGAALLPGRITVEQDLPYLAKLRELGLSLSFPEKKIAGVEVPPEQQPAYEQDTMRHIRAAMETAMAYDTAFTAPPADPAVAANRQRRTLQDAMSHARDEVAEQYVPSWRRPPVDYGYGVEWTTREGDLVTDPRQIAAIERGQAAYREWEAGGKIGDEPPGSLIAIRYKRHPLLEAQEAQDRKERAWMHHRYKAAYQRLREGE
jgi:hypothetical protein